MNSLTTNVLIGARKATEFVTRESPTILTIIGVSGLVTTVVLAVKATPKAIYLIRQEEYERAKMNNETDTIPLPRLDAIKIAWKCYIPSALVGLATAGCIIGSNSINLRRNAALGALYSLTETTLREYQQKVVETIGQNKETKIHDEIAQDRLNKDPLNGKEILVTGKGETLFYDSLSGRYFKSDMESIRRIQNNFNHELLSQMYMTLNEFYDELGLQDVAVGRDIGWTVEKLLDIHFSAKIADDGTPCIVLEYAVGPAKL